jgi:hypothetical protein
MARGAGARAYGIAPEELEGHSRGRTTLKVNVVPGDVAEAVLSSRRRNGQRRAPATA